MLSLITLIPYEYHNVSELVRNIVTAFLKGVLRLIMGKKIAFLSKGLAEKQS